jgi:F-type H+-transporting ATPase subunit a
VLTLFGFIFLRGPIPHISVAAEELFSVGPIDVTNTMLTSWIMVAFMIILVFFATRRWEMVPRGIQNVTEGAVEAFYNLVVGVAGEERGRRFFPIVATIFFMVLVFNWLALLPVFAVIGTVHEEEHGFVFSDCGPALCTEFSSPSQLSSPSIDEGDADAHEAYEEAVEHGQTVGELFPFFRAPNADLNTPLALAIVSAIAVETWAIRSLGIGYGKKFFNFGGLWRGITKFNFGMIFSGVIDVFVGLLELISELVRLVSFTFRLFGNVFAGEVVILMFTFLIPVVVTIAFYGLEVFVGVIQAFIFAMLTLVFAIMAVSHEEHGEHDSEHDNEHAEPQPQGSLEVAGN